MSNHATIRSERVDDVAAVFDIHAAAFPTHAEAKLVDQLRDAGAGTIRLVAEIEGEGGVQVVGHIVFSPVRITDAAGQDHATSIRGLGLAPVAVLPAIQHQGIGAQLIRAGLDAARDEHDADYVIVLGEPAYYARFGFQTASGFGLGNIYGVDEHFMAIVIRPDALKDLGSGLAGVVRFHAAFDAMG